jgi:bifunctional DNA-binding transcriptional regulator/antitoxin component of YhaV-PrlF toxin-antitoxin module
MGLYLTKMSPNGQIVLPAEMRRKYRVKPSAQFIVVRKGDGFYLNPVSEEEVLRELEVMELIDEGEKAIDEGRYLKVDSSMSAEEIDDLIMSGKWKSDCRRRS